VVPTFPDFAVRWQAEASREGEDLKSGEKRGLKAGLPEMVVGG
jgi:hypothetical protein